MTTYRLLQAGQHYDFALGVTLTNERGLRYFAAASHALSNKGWQRTVDKSKFRLPQNYGLLR